jgi:hypothetical protein
VILDAEFTLKPTEQDNPLEGTLPLPDQPVQTYWMPVPPLTGELTDAVTNVPASNQLLVGFGESYAELTVR